MSGQVDSHFESSTHMCTQVNNLASVFYKVEHCYNNHQLQKRPFTYVYSQGIHIYVKVSSGKDQQVYYYCHCHCSIDSDHNWNHAEVPVYRVTT